MSKRATSERDPDGFQRIKGGVMIDLQHASSNSDNLDGTIHSKLLGWQIPKIMEEIGDLLCAKGHRCVAYHGTKNKKLKWCQKDQCPATKQWDRALSEAKRVEARAEVLRKQGHVTYCGKRRCVHVK